MKYGLCASIWSENVGRVHKVAQQLEVKQSHRWEVCLLGEKPSTRLKKYHLFKVVENRMQQCCAAHIVRSCQQYCSALLHLIAG